MGLSTSAQANFTLPADTPISVKSILDFGAVADDTLNDSWAFIKAGKYFSNEWDMNGIPLALGVKNFDPLQYKGILVIPSGKYIVDTQINGTIGIGSTTYGNVFNQPLNTVPINLSNKYKIGLGGLEIKNCNQIEIRGIGDTIPEFIAPDIKTIGLFDAGGNPLFFTPNVNLGIFTYTSTSTAYVPSNSVYSSQYSVSIPSFIRIINSTNIYINNIEMDGKNNSTNTIYNGGNSVDYLQMGASGVYCNNSKNISLENLNINNMTYDGVNFSDDILSTSNLTTPSNLYMSNVICDSSRRNGLSIVGCKNYTLIDCQFLNTGQSVKNYINSGLYVAKGNPGAGIDLEPEDSGNNIDKYVLDGNMINVLSKNNIGNALVNDITYNRMIGLTLNNCKFWDVDGYSVYVKGHKITFNGGQIWGGFVFGNNGDIPGNETKFYNVDFADEEINGVTGDEFLLESFLYSKNMLFQDCHFRLIHQNKKFISLKTNSGIESEFTKFINCDFEMQANASIANNVTNVMIGCVFDGNNVFTNSDTSSKIRIFTNGIVVKGSSDYCEPNKFELVGKFAIVHSNLNGPSQLFTLGRDNIGSKESYLDFIINPGSCLYKYSNTGIQIGKHSKLLNKGQVIFLSGILENEGKVVFDNGSYYRINGTTNYSGLYPYSEFYIHKNSLNLINSTWINLSGAINSAWSPNMFANNSKFDGGNPVFTTYATSINDALLFNGNQVNIPYISKLNYAPITGNNFTIEINFKRESNAKGCIFSQGDKFEIGINSYNKIYVKFPTYNTQVATGYLIYLTNNKIIDLECHTLCLKRTAYTLGNISGSTLELFLDGKLIKVIGDNSTVLTQQNMDITLGNGIVGSYFNGRIGHVRIWDRSLEDCEISYNYSRKFPLNINGLIADWDMRDNNNLVTDAMNPPANSISFNGPTWVTQNQVGDCLESSNMSKNNLNSNDDNEVIKEVSNDNFSFYPNPNKGIFTVKYNSEFNKAVKILVFDITGKQIFNSEFKTSENNHEFQISMKNIMPGMYFIKLIDQNRTFSNKLLIE